MAWLFGCPAFPAIRIDGENHVHVKKDRNEKIDGSQSLDVGMSQQEKVGMKHALDAEHFVADRIAVSQGREDLVHAGTSAHARPSARSSRSMWCTVPRPESRSE